VSEPNKKFSLFPIERLAKSWENGGFYDVDFDRSILPFQIISGLFIEDVETLIPPDEFGPQVGFYLSLAAPDAVVTMAPESVAPDELQRNQSDSSTQAPFL
jgi:hypothetical protein